jgi:hypothetical protein
MISRRKILARSAAVVSGFLLGVRPLVEAKPTILGLEGDLEEAIVLFAPVAYRGDFTWTNVLPKTPFPFSTTGLPTTSAYPNKSPNKSPNQNPNPNPRTK